MKIQVALIAFLLFSITALSQKIKLNVQPEDANITVNGNHDNSSTTIKKNGDNYFIIAGREGYITKLVDIEKFFESGEEEFNISLEKINELPDSFESKKIELAKLIDATGKFQGTYVTSAYGSYRTQDIGDKRYVSAVVDVIDEWGYDIVGKSSVFKEAGSNPSFALAGELLNFGRDTKGSGFQISISISWSVFDIRKQKVVYELVTAGFSDSRQTTVFIEELEYALKNSIVGLLADKKFQDIVSDKEKEIVDNPYDEVTLIDSVGLIKKDKNMVSELVKSVLTIKTDIGIGSGFLISKDGYIITNHHVIENAEEIEVIFDNGFTFKAEEIKSLPNTDVALLQISGSGFTPLPVDISDNAASVGIDIIAIGTPADMSLGQSVSKGIVSGRRESSGINYIQTDASINLGNSGGPLINSEGEVVGIVVAKVRGVGIEGLAFGIPIDKAFEDLNIQFK